MNNPAPQTPQTPAGGNAEQTARQPRPGVVITLRPAAGVDEIPALKRLLKYAGRVCGLRCVSIVGEPPQAATEKKD